MYTCPLCHHQGVNHYFEDKRRAYLQCQQCELVFVKPDKRLEANEEKAHYDLHENDPSDAGYRRFLSRIADPLTDKISSNSYGLDFGCGPGPTLSIMLEEAGHTMVIEHLYHPDKVWQQWLNLVKPKGWIGLMTKLVIDVDAFAGWHYKNDPTHVAFFSRQTFQFLAERDKLELEFIGNDVILLRKTQ